MAKRNKAANTFSSLGVGPIPLELFTGESHDDNNAQSSALLFEIGGEMFAIGVEHTEGVVDCPRITPLPGPPDGITGVASVRGRMTLVMDLSLSAAPAAAKRRLILVKGEAQLGLLADRVEGVVALPPDKPGAASARGQKARVLDEASRWPVRYHFNFSDNRVPLIDVERLAEW